MAIDKNTTLWVVTSLVSPHSFDLFCHPARAENFCIVIKIRLHCKARWGLLVSVVFFNNKKVFQPLLWSSLLFLGRIGRQFWFITLDDISEKNDVVCRPNADFSKLRGIFNQISKTWLVLKNCSNKRTVWQTCRQNIFDHSSINGSTPAGYCIICWIHRSLYFG